MTESAQKSRGQSLLETTASDPPCTRGEVYVLPTSFAQRRLWFLDRFEPGGSVYNIPLAYRLDGPLDPAALARALSALAARHETLRTTFAVEGEIPVQVVRAEARVPLPVVDLSGLPGGRAGPEAERLAAAEAAHPFDLARGPLVRALLVRRARHPETRPPASRHLFLLTLHHAIADGWSLGVLRRELSALYRGHRTAPGGPPPPGLPELPIQYADYAAWQEEWLEGEEMARQLAYWRERLADAPGAMDLPFARRRPARRSASGGRSSRILAPELAASLDGLAAAAGATRFMVHLAAWQLLLHRLTPHAGRPDVVVGTPVSGRTVEETEGLIGLFVNTLVLRTDCAGAPSFHGLLERVKEGVLEAFAHQDVPFERLVEELVPERDLSYEPLVQVSFGVEEGGPEVLDLQCVRGEPVATDPGGVKFDLSLLIEEAGGGLRATLSYARDLFGRADAERLLRSYEALLEGVARAPGRPVDELPVAPRHELHRVLAEWSDGGPVPAGGLPDGATGGLHRLVELQAARTPDAVAVAAGSAALTYGELVRRSRRLAARLRRLGVGGEARVGLALGRTPEMVVAILAVFRAGGAYVPLDPAYPEERLAFMMEDAGVRVLLTDGAAAERLAGAAPGVRVVDLTEPAAWGATAPAEEPEVPPEALAYLIYTSGSTGRPKGVAITHGSAAAMVSWAGTVFGPEELSGLFAGTSASFDLSVFELLVPLSRGGRVLLGRDSLALAELPSAGAVRLVNTVPSAAAELVRLEALPPSVATVNLAGEPLPRDLVDRIYATSGAAKVYNLYGPSEDTTYSTAELVPRDDPSEPAIGRPVAGTRALVLDPGLRPVPGGVPGELCLAGAGLARGYLGRPARTARGFVPDPLAGAAGAPPGGRVYRTGDLVRHLPDGRLAFLGRMDHQVKLRGFRIELGEVETALAALPGVAAAAVLLRRDGSGDGRLAAYVAGPPEGPPPREEEMAARLGETLPAYMVPTAWAVLPELPLTPNGKIDRRALAAIEPSAAGAAGAGEERRQAPRTPEEEVLAGLWAELLGLECVGVRQSFFALGGHSLLATRLLSRVRRLFGVEVSLRALFEAPTVEALAERVVRARRESGADPERASPPVALLPRDRALPASFGQERLWFLHHLGEDEGSYNLSGALKLRGGLRSAALARALRGVVLRHEALRTVLSPAPAAGTGEAQVLQVVLGRVATRLPVLDLGALPAARREAEARRVAEGLAGRPFSLVGDRGPLFRFALLRLAPEEHLLVTAFHHAVSDGWSVEVFLRDLAALYGAALGGRPSTLPELPVQYPDFAAWQREELSGEALHALLAWWRERLGGLPPLLELPADRPRPAVRDARSGRLPVRLPAAVAGPLLEEGRRRGASRFMTCLALFQALLGRLAGTADLAVGTPVAGRSRGEVDDLVGLFVNTLVLRGDLRGDPTFAEVLDRARGTALDAYAHQEVPFEKLVEALRPERSLGHSPLFQAMLTVQNAPGQAPELPGLEAEPTDVGRGRVKFDLRLGLKERRGGLDGEVEFRRDLFDATTVGRWLRQLEALARAAAAEPERRLSELPLLPAPERHALLHEWSGVPSGRPETRSLAELVVRRAVERPEAVAVEGREGSLSYGELLRRAEALAGRLAAAGAGPDRPVAVYLERSPDLAVTLLAAVRAGAPAVPLDPDYPAARVAFMLEDSGAVAVVTAGALRGELPNTSARVLLTRGDGREPEDSAGLPEAVSALLAAAPAYVLYTSGSTGRPNGVAVPQVAVAEHVRAMAEGLPIGPADTVLWKTPAGFDPSVWELWAPLAAGARLALARPGAHRDPPSMAESLRCHRATVLRLVPTMFEAMLEEGGLAASPALRRLFVGGDVLPPAAAGRFLAASGAELVNSYGPTETTVTAAWHRVRPEDSGGPVPLGRPVGNLRAYSLDPTLRPLPAGAAGELVLAGPTLASGYRGRPGRTAERFVPDPFGGEPGGRLYRTGDRVRLRPQGGRLAFLGRLDHQVKLRGLRVEPGEVEALLAGEPEVERAAAVVRRDPPGEARLVAYAVLAAGAGDASALARDLRDRLARRLPPAMVPAAVVALPELPLLPNGKVDRAALSAGGAAFEAGRDRGERVPPRGPLETLVAEVWSDVLGVEGVGAHEDFFHLGGHSLLATRVVARLRERTGVELPLRRLFEDPTVAGLAACLGAAPGEEAAAGTLRALPRDRPLPATFAASYGQERLWFLDRYGGDRSAYNVPAPRRLRGPLDLPALARAFTALARRHEALRTTLRAAEGEPPAGQPESAAVQVVHPPAPVPLPVVDLAGLPDAVREAELRRLAGAEARRPFDLEAGPLLRVAAARLGPADHALLLALHHAVSDGWSMGVLFRELGALYGGAGDLPVLPVQYADVAVWQRRVLAGETLARELAFWRERLAGAPAVLELPTDRPRPAVRGGRGGTVPWRLSGEATAGLRRLAAAEKTSLFAVLLAGYQALLARVTGATDVPVGAPVANRNHAETEGLIGFLVNTLVLRGDLSGDPTFAVLLARTREATLEAWAHQDLPFEKLVEELRPERQPSHTPIFQVMLALQNVPEAAAELSGVPMEPVPLDGQSAKFDLTVAARETAGALVGQAELDRDLFDPTTVRRLLGAFTTLLAGAAAEPGRRLSELPLLGPAARHQLLAEWNDDASAYPRASLAELLAFQVARAPDAVAVSYGARRLTYGELGRRGAAVARLLQAAGSGPDVPVGIAIERSADMVVGVAGIALAGAAYLPLDPDYPEERLRFMLEDAGAPVVLVAGGTPPGLGAAVAACGAAVVDLVEAAAGAADGGPLPEETEAGPGSLAYITYTSGSTGRPKGVAVPQGAVARLVFGQGYAALGPDRRLAQASTLAFDAATFEIWGALLHGGTLVGIDRDLALDLEALAAELARRRVTTAFLTTALFNQVVQVEAGLSGIDELLFGGEACDPERVRLAVAGDGRGPRRLLHVYGPTECTTFASWHPVEDVPAGAVTVPIGRPLANTTLQVADAGLAPVAAGVPGELLLGGDGLARGYWRRPALTAGRFVPDPLSGRPGARLYKTGDRVRLDAAGRVVFQGRFDHQVKVRGFRIEPGEIETRLALHPAVAAQVVVAREDVPGERRLVAYAVAAEGASASARELRDHLAAGLPDYMVPSAVVLLPELPLTPNGKVDRPALPAPEDTETRGPEGFVPPRGPFEEMVAEVWAELLPAAAVGAHDDFFDLGGHSLLATRVVSRLRQLTGAELPLRHLFEHPTVAALARLLEESVEGAAPGEGAPRKPAPPLEPVSREGRREADGTVRFPASFAQERLWFLGSFGADRAQYNVPAPVSVEGRLEAAPLARSLGRIVRRHEALRTVFARGETGVVQRVLPPGRSGAGRLPVIDLARLPRPARTGEARRLAAADARRPFDLARGPLFRAALARLSADGEAGEHLLLLSMHHIVTDGWSLARFFAELGALYGGFREGSGHRRTERDGPAPELPSLPVQYGDFAVWQRAWLSGEVLERQLAYWRERLAGAPSLLELPTDRPRPPVQTLAGGEARVAFPPELLAGLRRLSRARGVSLFMVLLAGLQTLLGRLAGTDDVSVGAPIAGRTRSEVEGLIGFFVNTLVFRGDLAGDPSFAGLLARTREAALDAYAHQELPFEKLVEELRPERNLAHSPIFQVMLALQNAPAPAPALPGVEAAEPFDPGAAEGAKFDLTLGLGESPRGLLGDLTYNRDLFDGTTVRRLLGQLRTLLASAAAAPERRVSELDLLAPAERHQLLREWNDTAPAAPAGAADALLHAPFERRAAERPDAVAVVAGGREHLSYGELDRRSARLARALSARGVGPGSLVGVYVGRGLAMPAAVLAVERAGGAYVPLEAGWPAERIRWIVSEHRVRHLVTETSRFPAAAGLGVEGVLAADDPPEAAPAPPAVAACPEDPAYVIFTSGSTGHPKGVVVRHRPAANLVSWVNRTFSVGPDERLLFVTALSFDLSVYDLFGTLAAGATVRLATSDELDDPVRQVEVLAAERITFWDSAPAALQRLAPLFPAAPASPAAAPALRRVFLSGDWVPLSLPGRVRGSYPAARVIALGGATEATVWSNYFPVGEVSPDWASVPYGRPIAGARYHVLDGSLWPCPVGVAGDLYIAGGCLSSGYAGSPRQTAESYLPDPFAGPEGPSGAVLYKTGDRARYFPDGNLEFLGRLDTQVKVRGFRIELGEIEAVLMEHPEVAEAVVLAREDTPGDQRLVAYWIPAGAETAAPEELRRWVGRKLPEYMVPTAWVPRERWPLSPTGKLDRKALPAPRAAEAEASGEAEAAAPAVAPRTALERTLAAVWREVLGVESVPREANFFDLGGHSLLLARVHERVEEELGRQIPMVELFRNPTVASLAAALGDDEPEEAEEARAPRRRPAGDGAVAVVGMAGRFPGARDVEALWRNLRAGVESIRFFSDEELAEAGFEPAELRDPSVVKARGALDDPDLFDAAFFGYSPREAEVIDPQQRLFLETSWQALEDAGHGGPNGGRVGVFGGVSESAWLHRLRSDPELARTVGGQQIAISNHPDYLSTRVSYKLHLTGPSMAVQTACSTSLVAVHMACQSLLAGECDLALAGGASVRVPEVSPYRYAEGGIASPDGHVRAFDARARGVVSGSGVGVVVLKRLEDAVADGDAVRAVILGSGVNNDGGLKAGFTAPSAEGQAEVIRDALEAAGVDPATIGYVEAHGTATPMGDPIEVQGLTRAFGPFRAPGRKTCALGSVKTNIGHLDAAAGVAGLIKAVLALERREIPPSLHFQEPNPELGLDGGPFFVADRLLPWEPNGAPRRAGVSSFGIGGTNAHVVLEEAPPREDEAASEAGPGRAAELLVLSAKTESALDRATEALARHLRERPEAPLADVAWTLQTGRRALPWRRAVVAPTRAGRGEGAAEALESLDRRWSWSGLAPEEPPRVAFLFPGQGAQFPGMGEALYREEPVFRNAFDRSAEVLAPELGLDLRELLYGETGERLEETEERLAETALTQPALFAVEHALAELWTSWGIAPAALLGHSLGEYVAATLAGVLRLEDALRLVAARGRLMGSRPGGAMLGVRLGEEALAPYLPAGGPVELAAVNAPDACVVAGPGEAVAALRERLEGEGVSCRALHTSHAFHSGVMEPVMEPFRELVSRVELRPPQVPFVSNVTGTWITAAEATDPGYWARQLRRPVRFAAGLSALAGGSEEAAAGWAFLEVGPGRTLTTLARHHPAALGARALVPSTRQPRQAGSDRERALSALGALWVAGVGVDWRACHAGADGRVRRRRVPLPTYPFERRSFWIGGGRPRRSEEAMEAAAPAPAPATQEAALSEVESAVAAAFRDLLGVGAADRGDDFFELGGSSLMAVQLGSRIRELAGVDLTSDALLQASTVGELAALVEARRAAEASGEGPAAASCLVPLRRTGSRRPLFVVHQVGGHVYSFRPLVRALPADQPVYGLRSRGLEPGEEPCASVEPMAEHYLELAREVQPRGPYRIAGASMGGMVAFEMARQLREAGQEVELLALMDTPCGEQMPPRPEEDYEFVAPVFAGVVPLSREELSGMDAEAQLRYALAKADREAGGAGFDLDGARRLSAVLRANVGALFAYRPAPGDGRLVFFRAREKRPGEPPRPEMPWIELAPEGTEVVLVPGNHATMHDPPGAEVMARYLEPRLAARAAPGRPL